MPQHFTYFTPTAVITTDTDTGKKTIEIDFTNSAIRDNDHWILDPKRSEDDVSYMDEILASTSGYFEKSGDCIIRLHSLDFTS